MCIRPAPGRVLPPKLQPRTRWKYARIAHAMLSAEVDTVVSDVRPRWRPARAAMAIYRCIVRARILLYRHGGLAPSRSPA